MSTLDRTKLSELLKQEEYLFHKNHPKSYALYQRARKSLHGGVWMIHNIALISPDTIREDVDYHTKVFREAVQSLFG